MESALLVKSKIGANVSLKQISGNMGASYMIRYAESPIRCSSRVVMLSRVKHHISRVRSLLAKR